jgi:hypothetical protein
LEVAMPALPWKQIETPDPGAEYVVMGSRLPLRGYRFVPRFLAQSLRIRRQLASTPGLVGYGLDARLLHKEFRTVSVWESDQELARFARSQPHAGVTATKRRRMGASQFVTWTARSSEIPVPWDVVDAHLSTAAPAGGTVTT